MRRYLKERRERNRQLAVRDGERRCTACKQALPALGSITRWSLGERFCSEACWLDHEERKAMR